MVHIWQNLMEGSPDVGEVMAGCPRVVATVEQCRDLRALAGSSDREEADRARAILLSLEGWSSFRIGEAFSVEPDSVRHWRWTFGREGVAGLRARKKPGPEPVKARAALSVVAAVLSDEVSVGRTGRCRGCRTRSRREVASASRSRGSAW